MTNQAGKVYYHSLWGSAALYLLYWFKQYISIMAAYKTFQLKAFKE